MTNGRELPPGYEPPVGLFDQWREIGPGVLVRRHRELDLNVTLVLGGEAALVVDTTSHAASARALVGAIRAVTALPWVVVNTPRALRPLLRQRHPRRGAAGPADLGARRLPHGAHRRR